jgi:hypothetical protein
MNRSFVRPVSLLLAAAAIPAALFAAPVPVSANSGIICEASGNFCIGASSLSAGTPVKEVSGSAARQITQVLVSGTTNQFTLVFAGTSSCVTANNTLVFVESCSSNGTVWIKQITSSTTFEFKSRPLGTFLSGHNNGTQYFLAADGATGARQEFENGT